MYDLRNNITDKKAGVFYNAHIPKISSKAGMLEEMSEVAIDGVKYIVDGHAVKYDPTMEEKDIAKSLAEYYGYDVKINPRVVIPQGVQSADFTLNGVKYDLKSPIGEGRSVLYNMVNSKKKQAQNFIFNIDKCPLPYDEVEKQLSDIFRSDHTKFINTIIVMKNKKIIKIYTRK